ncbi:hypothetical protein Trebr_0914 [Treponema brennaborense DSM 12168]|uniref:Uncharacterized protein n=2 Tax=Treponema TaxID=157 RepID=F4LJ93_TREBD|nr:hypothetical protein Trebr_0914 [Treponema brennaborense DSM 12168]
MQYMKRILLTILFTLSVVCAYVGCSSPLSTLPLVVSGAEPAALTALNKNARKAAVSGTNGSRYAYFAFSEAQRGNYVSLAASEGAVSLEIEISAPISAAYAETAAADRRFAFGLLYDSDFSASGRLRSALADRPMAAGVFSSENRQFRVAYAVPAAQAGRVRGFFFYTAVSAAVTAASVIPGEVGFDFSGEVPRFCFAGNGGSVPETGAAAFTAFDFTEADSVFGSGYTGGEFVPVFTVSLRETGGGFGSVENQTQVKLSFGGETVSIRRAPGQTAVSVHAAALRSAFSRVSAESNADMIRGVSLHFIPSGRRDTGTVIQPLRTDPGLIPAWPSAVWRSADYELFEWEQFPGVLFFDTANYAVQDQFFKRLAFFTEKTGYIGTLVPDGVLNGKHGFNAHDYRPETLADFFTLAERTSFPLSEKELLLKEILLCNGIIAADAAAPGTYRSGIGGVISVSQESPLYLRHSFVAHEGLHGLYFIDADFRTTVSQVFSRMDPLSLQFLIRYFQVQPSLNYNTADTYLLENEFMAYIMQQPVSRTGNYFVTRASWNSMTAAEPELCAYVKATGGSGFTDAARILNEYVFRRWGFSAGRVSLVTR